MSTLAIAFSLAWIAVASYVTWLGWQHHRLRRRLDELETMAGQEQSGQPSSRAA